MFKKALYLFAVAAAGVSLFLASCGENDVDGVERYIEVDSTVVLDSTYYDTVYTTYDTVIYVYDSTGARIDTIYKYTDTSYVVIADTLTGLDTVEVDWSNKPTARLTFVVRDAVTGEYLPGAEVRWMASEYARTDSSQTTNDNGYVEFPETYVNSVGSLGHLVMVTLDGYAPATFRGTISRATAGAVDRDDYYIAMDNTVEANLYPTSSKLIGNLYYRTAAGGLAPADTAEVRLTVSNQPPYNTIINRTFSVRVNEAGLFMFDSLPAVGNNYELSVRAYDAHCKGADSLACEAMPRFAVYNYPALGGHIQPLIDDLTTWIPIEPADILETPLSTFRYMGPFGDDPLTDVARSGPKAAIVLPFSEKIDPSSIWANPIRFISGFDATTGNPNYIHLAANAPMIDDKNIVITPIFDWERSKFWIEIEGEYLRSESGNKLSDENVFVEINVEVRSLLTERVANFKIDSTYAFLPWDSDVPNNQYVLSTAVNELTQFVRLRWDRVEDADYYVIQRRPHGTNTFISISDDFDNIAQFEDDTLSVWVPIVNDGSTFQRDTIGNKSVAFRIQAVNVKSRTIGDDLTTVVVASNPTVRGLVDAGKNNMHWYPPVGQSFANTFPPTVGWNFGKSMCNSYPLDCDPSLQIGSATAHHETNAPSGHDNLYSHKLLDTKIGSVYARGAHAKLSALLRGTVGSTVAADTIRAYINFTGNMDVTAPLTYTFHSVNPSTGDISVGNANTPNLTGALIAANRIRARAQWMTENNPRPITQGTSRQLMIIITVEPSETIITETAGNSTSIYNQIFRISGLKGVNGKPLNIEYQYPHESGIADERDRKNVDYIDLNFEIAEL